MNHAEGFYNCRIVAQGFGELPNEKKTPYFEITVVPIEQINTATGEKTPLPGDQQRQSEKMFITPATMEKMFPSQLKAMGCDGVDFVRLGDPQHPNYINLAGRVVLMLNKPEADKDNPQKFYDKFSVFSQAPKEPPKSDPNVAMRLQTLFGRELQQKTAAAVVSQPQAQTATVPQVQAPPQTYTNQPPVPQTAPQQAPVPHQTVFSPQGQPAQQAPQTTQHQGLPF